MMAYLEVANKAKGEFKSFEINQIPRDLNAEADSLANLGATFKAGSKFKWISIMHVLEPVLTTSYLTTWMRRTNLR